MSDGWMMGGRVDDEGWMDKETDDRRMMDGWMDGRKS